MRAALVVAGLVLALLVPSPPATAVETPIAVSPLAVDFGPVVKGVTKQVEVLVTNTGTSSFGPIEMYGGNPPSADFSGSQTCQGVTLAAGASCGVFFTFTPTYFGPAQDMGTFVISTSTQSAGEEFNVALKGRGVSPLRMTPTALDFGDVAVGASTKRAVQVTNTTAAPVGPIAVADGGAPSAAFAVDLAACQGQTLAAGASCVLTYTFAPKAAGRAVESSSVHISATSSLAAGATFAVAMTGCGPPCGPVVHHGRTVTLKVRGRLTATGKVKADDGLGECVAGVPVQIQRRQGKRWRTVETATTSAKGGYHVALADRAGSYRAAVTPRVVGAGAGLCDFAASRARRAD